MRHKEKSHRSVWRVLGNILYAAIFAVCALVIILSLMFREQGVAIGGHQLSIVLSDSMAPTFQAGSILVTRQAPSGEIAVGDIVTFETEGTLVTHRVSGVYMESNNRWFITKGDANSIPDRNPVSETQIRGRVSFSIAYLGFVLLWLKSPIALFAVAAAAAALAVLSLAIKRTPAASCGASGARVAPPRQDGGICPPSGGFKMSGSPKHGKQEEEVTE